MVEILHKNIEALQEAEPLLAQNIKEISGNKKFEIFMDANDIANINIIDKTTNTPLYITKPIDETIKRIEDFREYTYHPYLYFFGVGNGVFYKMLLGNTLHKRIVIFEPEIELLYIALHLVDFSEEINSKRVVFIHSRSFDFAKGYGLINFEDAKLFSKVYDLHMLLPYYNRYESSLQDVNKTMIRAIEHCIIAVGNDAKDSIMGLEHHIKNLPEVVKSPYLPEFINKLNNTDTAIIASTGPSLAKQLPLLKEIQDFVTIISIDASFPILCANGIKPDVVVSLERIPLTADFYKKTPKECHKDVIFAITSIVHQELKDAIQGGIKQFSLRPFGYTKYFNTSMWGYLGIGMSAANKAYEMVAHSRIKNLIFIGQDLAYGEDGKTHSKGYTLNEDEFKPNTTNLFIEKYGGGGVVRTNDIWKLFLNFFETDIANTSRDLKVINSTEGGARIHGADEIPFCKAIDVYVDKSKKKEPIKPNFPSAEDSAAYLKQAENRVIELLSMGKKVQKEIEDVFLENVAILEYLEKLNNEGKLEEIDYTKLSDMVDKIDKIKDYFHDQRFVEAFIDAVQSFIIHQELDIAKIQVKYTEDDMHRKARIIEWLYAHKYWLFSLAGGINNVLHIVARGASDWVDIPEDLKPE